jgi:CRP-like cAMP-binding protein
MSNGPQSPHRNLLLRGIEVSELRRLNDSLEPITGVLGESLAREGESPEWAYFPEDAVVSIVRILESGAMIEVGVIGFDGVVGVHSIARQADQPYRSIVQNEGKLWRMPMNRLREEFRRAGEFQEKLLQFSTSFLLQVSQTAACNRLHNIERRLARWLLMMRDRTVSDQLSLTQEFLSHMLGTRIAGVNEALQTLKLSGLVRHGRGKIEIIDREGLEQAACECYAFVKDRTTH